MAIDCLIILLNGIPLIHSNNNTLTTIMGNTCNLSILFGYAFTCINDYNNNISTFYRTYGTDDTKTLNLFFDLTLSTKSSRINKDILFILPGYSSIYGISGSTSNVGYDYA